MATHPFESRLPFAAVLGLLAACGGDATEPVGPPATLTAVTQGALSGVVASTLNQPLTVRVTDADGRPVSGVNVDFNVSTGGGLITLSPAVAPVFRGSASSIAAAIDTTDVSGEARASWTLGTKSGEQTATAVVAGLTTVTFTATAAPDGPADFDIPPETAFIGIAGQLADGSVMVEVDDQFNNPIPGVSVNWSVIAGGGTVGAATSTTDEEGRAQVNVTLGPSHGLNLVGMTVPGLGSDTIGLIGVVGTTDPIGDQFDFQDPAWVSHDITFFGGAHVGGEAVLYFRFGAAVRSAAVTGEQPANAVAGWMDLDTDQDSTTGYYAFRQCIGGDSLGFGTDAFVNFDPRATQVDIPDASEGAIVIARVDSLDSADRCNAAYWGSLVATVPEYRGNTFSFLLPLTFLQDDGVFDFTSFAASPGAGFVTDLAPDSLAYTFDLSAMAAAQVRADEPAVLEAGDALRHLRGRFLHSEVAVTAHIRRPQRWMNR